MDQIQFRSGYKYQLAADYIIQTTIKPHKNSPDHRYVRIEKNGLLKVSEGYAWDGASGPVLDTSSNMRASLVHDALYQLIRLEYLSLDLHKDPADLLFKELCIIDGVPEDTAQFYYLGLKLLGRPSADPKNLRKVRRAP